MVVMPEIIFAPQITNKTTVTAIMRLVFDNLLGIIVVDDLST
jgi:hypothetical protein